MIENIASVPLLVKSQFKSIVLENMIDSLEYAQGCIIDDTGKLFKWNRAEYCLYYNNIDNTIPANWSTNIEQVKLHTAFVTSEVTRLRKYIVNNLPIDVSYISIQKSKGNLYPHFDITDQSTVTTLPTDLSLIKIMLDANTSIDKLYFTNGISNFYFTKNHLPLDTNIFAWSSKRYKHGVTDLTLDANRILINIYGTFNHNNYYNLIQESIKQYQHVALRVV